MCVTAQLDGNSQTTITQTSMKSLAGSWPELAPRLATVVSSATRRCVVERRAPCSAQLLIERSHGACCMAWHGQASRPRLIQRSQRKSFGPPQWRWQRFSPRSQIPMRNTLTGLVRILHLTARTSLRHSGQSLATLKDEATPLIRKRMQRGRQTRPGNSRPVADLYFYHHCCASNRKRIGSRSNRNATRSGLNGVKVFPDCLTAGLCFGETPGNDSGRAEVLATGATRSVIFREKGMISLREFLVYI